MSRVHVSYQWNLRQLMAQHELWKATDLAPLLEERGISLSYSQIHRLVTEKPERLSLRTLAALCDIFECTPNDLIEAQIESVQRRAANSAIGADEDGNVAIIRPTRARITDINR
jgi:DNA-binding Xre family transcriptional regulator